MASNKGLMSQLGEAAKNNPAVDRLREEATDYLAARGRDLAGNLGDRLGGATDKLQDAADNGGVLGKTAKRTRSRVPSVVVAAAVVARPPRRRSSSRRSTSAHRSALSTTSGRSSRTSRAS